eukprot:7779106-Pyramimonas_sp.AAC.1
MLMLMRATATAAAALGLLALRPHRVVSQGVGGEKLHVVGIGPPTSNASAKVHSLQAFQAAHVHQSTPP